MAAIYRSDGAQLEMITPVGGVTQGQIVAIGDIIGIAAETAAAGTGMTLLRSGVFTVPNGKDAAFRAGDAVYFSAETGETSTQIGSLPLLGYAVSDVVEGNSTAVVLLAYAQPAGGSTPVAIKFFSAYISSASGIAIIDELVNNDFAELPDILVDGNIMSFDFGADDVNYANSICYANGLAGASAITPRMYFSGIGPALEAYNPTIIAQAEGYFLVTVVKLR